MAGFNSTGRAPASATMLQKPLTQAEDSRMLVRTLPKTTKADGALDPAWLPAFGLPFADVLEMAKRNADDKDEKEEEPDDGDKEKDDEEEDEDFDDDELDDDDLDDDDFDDEDFDDEDF